MKILFIKTNVIGEQDVIEAFKKIQCKVDSFTCNIHIKEEVNLELYEILEIRLREKGYDCVFTLDFDVTISEVCNTHNVRYVSWVVSTPNMELYHISVKNKCNHIYIFDKKIRADLLKIGIKNVNYLPLGVSTSRIASRKKSIERNIEEKNRISFVGNFHIEQSNDYKLLSQIMDPYVSSFLEAIVQGQRNVPKENIIERSLQEKIIQKMENKLPCGIGNDTYLTPQYIYSNCFIYHRITMLERLQAIMNVSKVAPVNIYSNDFNYNIENCINKGRIDYYTELPKVIYNSDINLNITSRTIPTGISQHALNILACEGFLITDYQEEMFDFFDPELDFVYYESMEELKDKIIFYLKHEEMRKKIAYSGYQKINMNFDYTSRIRKIAEDMTW